MKCFTIIIPLLILLCHDNKCSAQIGVGDFFDYWPDGSRKIREIRTGSLGKHGSQSAATQADAQFFDKIKPKADTVVVKAYPNPTNDIVFVENLTWKQGNTATVQLYDITGKFISSKEVVTAKHSISLNGLPTGTYDVHYYLNDKLLTSWRIVKN